jgi:hypothetical protein
MNKIRWIKKEAAEAMTAVVVAEDADTQEVEATWEGVADQDVAEAEAEAWWWAWGTMDRSNLHPMVPGA